MKKAGLLIILILIPIFLVGIPDVTAPAGDEDMVWRTTIFPEVSFGEHDFGNSVAVGDVNGDGLDDVIVATAVNVYVYEIRSEMDPVVAHPMLIIDTDNPYVGEENDVAVADLNNDNIQDIIIGNYYGAPSYDYHGNVYVFYGKTEWTTVYFVPIELDVTDSDWHAGGPSDSEKFGLSVANAGDVNVDGIDDLIVGAPGESLGKGRAYVYYGSNTGLPADQEPDAIIPPTDVWEMTQNSIIYNIGGGLGNDVAKDGHYIGSSFTSDNFIIGIPGADIDLNSNGVYSAGETDVGVALIGPRWWCLSGDNIGHSNFGSSLGNAGDVNGDGHPDVLISASNSSYSLYSKVFLYLGDSDRVDTTQYAWSVEGFNYRSWAPNPVGSAGDINGDGYCDIYIGDHLYNPDEIYGADGRVCIWYGDASTSEDPSGLRQNRTPETADLILDPYDINSYVTGMCINFGYAVASGDINGDGLSDIIIGDPETYHPYGGTEPGVQTGSVSIFLSGFPSPPSDSTHLVVRGSDNRIYYRNYSDDVWGNWKVVPTGTTCDSPAAAVYDYKLYMVVRGIDSNSLWFGSVDLSDDSFSGWDWISGSTPSAPTLTCYDKGTGLVLAVRGTDNRIYYRQYDITSDTWYDWNVRPAGTTCDSPAAVMVGSWLHLVVRGETGHGLYYESFPISTPGFLGWDELSGDTLSTPTLVNDNGGFYLVVRGMDDVIYYNYYSVAGEDWMGWTQIPGALTRAREYGPAVTVIEDELHLVVISTDTNLYHSWLDLETNVWDDWNYISGITQSPPTFTN